MESVNPEGMSETISNGDNNSEKGNSCSEHDSGSGNSMISVPNAKLNPNNSGELWEVKYGKLREVALKLKKSVLEKSQEIERLKSENTKAIEKSQNLSTIQHQFDMALDEVEKYKSLEVSLQKDLQASIRENIGLKESNFELQSQVKNLVESSKALNEKLETYRCSDADSTHLKSRVEELEIELKAIREIQADVKQEKRQRAILSLEITDYEKKLGDANAKIVELEQELVRQQKLFNDKDEALNSGASKLSEAEIMIGDLKSNSEILKNDIAQKVEKIAFLQAELEKLNEKLTAKNSELTKVSREYEGAKLNFSLESSGLVERCDKLTQMLSQYEHKISILEEHKRGRESHISNLKLELVQLETEFSNYKLKAQTMLNIQKPSGKTPSGRSDELENLQKIVQDFHSEIAVLKSDMKTLKLENEALSLERADLGLKLTQMKTEAVEKQLEHDNEIQKWKDTVKEKELQFQSALENAKIHNAAVVTSYIVQLDSMRSESEMQLRKLEEEISRLKAPEASYEFDTWKHEPHSFQGSEIASNEMPIGPNLPLTIDTSSGGGGLDLRMIPRGECEGSENHISPQKNLLQTPSANFDMTFEELLSTDLDNVSYTSNVKNQNLLKDELMRCRTQIKHLQSILRESESNCDRLTQLSEALKQEIRRVERDSERKEHLKENSEYLKNIIIKFTTLSGEDEKRRLIPVISTMLRLSSSEAEQLETAIKGGHHSHSSRDEAPIVGGWSSFVPLPRWSFGGSGK